VVEGASAVDAQLRVLSGSPLTASAELPQRGSNQPYFFRIRISPSCAAEATSVPSSR
jgi:hypothetical protein